MDTILSKFIILINELNKIKTSFDSYSIIYNRLEYYAIRDKKDDWILKNIELKDINDYEKNGYFYMEIVFQNEKCLIPTVIHQFKIIKDESKFIFGLIRRHRNFIVKIAINNDVKISLFFYYDDISIIANLRKALGKISSYHYVPGYNF